MLTGLNCLDFIIFSHFLFVGPKSNDLRDRKRLNRSLVRQEKKTVAKLCKQEMKNVSKRKCWAISAVLVILLVLYILYNISK